MRTCGLYVNGQYVQTSTYRDARSPDALAGEKPFARVAQLEGPEADDITEAALEGAWQTFRQIEAGFFPLHERLAFLNRLRAKLDGQLDYLAELVCLEVGKPIRQTRGEIERGMVTIDTTLRDAPALLSPAGLPTTIAAASANVDGWTLREPRGPLFAITPFNFPVNLVLHKIVPAIVSGCPVILKPSPKAAVSATVLADLCHAAELPAGMLSVVHAEPERAQRILQDKRVAHVSFTGSATVGWSLAKLAGGKPIALELGGNGPVFVAADADLDRAAAACVLGGFGYAGQVCISTQNIFVEAPALPRFRDALVREFDKLVWARPRDEAAQAGCVIDDAAAKRLREALARAQAKGARVVATKELPDGFSSASERPGTYVSPAIVEGAPLDDAFVAQELFGPYVNLLSTPDFDTYSAWSRENPTRFQTAVFTSSLALSRRAARALKYGAVLINQGTNTRFEGMPFGGRGESGTGREGPAYAIESFTELKSVLVSS